MLAGIKQGTSRTETNKQINRVRPPSRGHHPTTHPAAQAAEPRRATAPSTALSHALGVKSLGFQEECLKRSSDSAPLADAELCAV